MGTGNLQTARTLNKFRRGSGGASRDRTDDLLHAMQALSQLSYSPSVQIDSVGGTGPPKERREITRGPEECQDNLRFSVSDRGQRGRESLQAARASQQRKRHIDGRRCRASGHRHPQGLRHLPKFHAEPGRHLIHTGM
jgi:hypothetical protein